jgi:hypothetical protein
MSRDDVRDVEALIRFEPDDETPGVGTAGEEVGN